LCLYFSVRFLANNLFITALCNCDMMPANRDRNNTQYLCGRRCMTCAKSSVSIRRSSLTAPTHLTSCTCDSTEMLFQLLFYRASANWRSARDIDITLWYFTTS